MDRLWVLLSFDSGSPFCGKRRGLSEALRPAASQVSTCAFCRSTNSSLILAGWSSRGAGVFRMSSPVPFSLKPLAVFRGTSGGPPRHPSSQIRLVRAPHVKRVRGCIDMSYLPASTSDNRRDLPVFNATTRNVLVSGFLEVGRTSLGTVQGAERGTTRSCLREGGETITLTGAAFGAANVKVYVDGKPCSQVAHTKGKEEVEVSCVLPPMSSSTPPPSWTGTPLETSTPLLGEGFHHEGAASAVEVTNGRMPGLKHVVPFLSYQAPSPPPRKPTLSNIAARSIDVSWEPSHDFWDVLAVTGYQVGWKVLHASNGSFGNGSGIVGDMSHHSNYLGPGIEGIQHLMTVGNVTKTTVRGLSPATTHAFWVRALAENRSDATWEQVDPYGRRNPLEGAVVGFFSDTSDVGGTLMEDVVFERFDANATLNHSSEGSAPSLGPRGQWAGEGHYGLRLVGSAQVENCNRSTSCCDDFDSLSGLCGHEGAGSGYLCVDIPGSRQQQTLDVDPYSKSSAPWVTVSGPEAGSSVSAPRSSSSTVVIPHAHAHTMGWTPSVSSACGPALRLTASHPGSSGAAWYPREETVGEGFDTTFTFRISSPSVRCNVMDGVHTHCRSRGADGLAFVIQAEGPTALGAGGMGLGYDGISNMLAVEFDTYYNPDLLEPYENHVSVQTRGWRDPGSAHNSYALGATPNVPDLTDGEIVARVVYTPIITADAVFGAAFQASEQIGYFMSNADFTQGGLPDWGTGIGLLTVYINNPHEPCLMVPLNLEATLRLNHGRAYVGFTAATGRDTWQVIGFQAIDRTSRIIGRFRNTIP